MKKHQTIPLLYKERIFEDRENNLYITMSLRPDSSALPGSLPKAYRLKLDGYTAIATDNLEADNLPLIVFSADFVIWRKFP